MKRLLSSVLSFCLIFLALFFAGCVQEDVPTPTTVKVVGLGDSISAGYAPQNTDLYEYYYDYLTGKTKVNQMCFTNVVANKLVDSATKVEVKSYAESGDTTDDLVNKLNDTKTYPALLGEIKKANVITLCIGANNVLGPALNNLMDYIAGDITEEEIRAEMLSGYENFRDDYTNRIIPILTRGKAKVIVMTIYDPYKYFDMTEATAPVAFEETLAQINVSFQSLKSIAIEFLDKINAYIKSQRYDNVTVVDVNANFESLSKESYAKYLNVDASKIVISNLIDLMGLQSNKYVDPHPTLEGQAYIATLYENALKDAF